MKLIKRARDECRAPEQRPARGDSSLGSGYVQVLLTRPQAMGESPRLAGRERRVERPRASTSF